MNNVWTKAADAHPLDGYIVINVIDELANACAKAGGELMQQHHIVLFLIEGHQRVHSRLSDDRILYTQQPAKSGRKQTT